MKILVIDVAAETGGALTILEQFRNECETYPDNEYVFLLSLPKYESGRNVKYKNYEWVKKSWLHRLWFDNFYIRKIIKKEQPDLILSLQNKAVASCGIRQEVYFHNVLLISDNSYSWRETKNLWVYQRLIAPVVRHSLKKASIIYVQANWIKKKLNKKWNIDANNILVKEVEISWDHTIVPRNELRGCHLFYPANYAVYKNHVTLLRAYKKVWDMYSDKCRLKLTLTGDGTGLNSECTEIIKSGDYNVEFCGYLTRDEMREMYRKTVLIYPSELETIGLPLMEAMQYNCKIIAANLEYAHETLGQYKEACYFEPRDVDALKREIIKLMKM